MQIGRLAVPTPIALAPMAGVSTPKLVAAVSAAGGLGTHGAAFLGPDKLRSDIRAIRAQLEGQPFGVNIFALGPVDWRADAARVEAAVARLRPYYERVGVPPEECTAERIDKNPPPRMEEQLAVVVQERVPLLSFTFGRLGRDWIERLHAAGTVVMGTATTVEEAQLLVSDGVDAVCAQGSEAGGHRGSFTERAPFGGIGTMALVPQIVDAVPASVPVLAAGGIFDSRGVQAALALGARGVAVGTAFIVSSDSEASAVHKNLLCRARDVDSVVTDAFTGRAARGLRNEFSDTLAPAAPLTVAGSRSPMVAPYPAQQALTGPIKKACIKAGHGDLAAVWGGQGVAKCPETAGRPAKAIVEWMAARL